MIEARLNIDAPPSTLHTLMREFIRLPVRFDDEIVWSRELSTDGLAVLRETCRASSGGMPLIDRATMSDSATGLVVTVTPLGPDLVRYGPVLSLQSRSLPAGTVELVLTLDGGSDDGAACLSRLAGRLKSLAEGASQIPPWLASYYRAVDDMDPDAVVACMTRNCTLRAANFPAAVGHDAIREASLRLWSSLNGIRHNIVNIVETDRETAVEVVTEYLTKADVPVALRASSFFRREGDLIAAVTFYLDAAPLHDGWPGAPH